jgi:hypothetical protein
MYSLEKLGGQLRIITKTTYVKAFLVMLIISYVLPSSNFILKREAFHFKTLEKLIRTQGTDAKAICFSQP